MHFLNPYNTTVLVYINVRVLIRVRYVRYGVKSDVYIAASWRSIDGPRPRYRSDHTAASGNSIDDTRDRKLLGSIPVLRVGADNRVRAYRRGLLRVTRYVTNLSHLTSYGGRQ